MDTRPVYEQLEIEFPPPTRERLAARKRPWGLRQLAIEIGCSPWFLYAQREKGFLKCTRFGTPGGKRPAYQVEPQEAMRFYESTFKEYDPDE